MRAGGYSKEQEKTVQSTLLDEDDVVMRLVEDALARPQPERTAYLRQTCGTDSTLCDQALKYIEWEELMGNFLLEPLVKRAQPPNEFEPGELLIDRFRLVRKVGEGGMGTVWDAIDGKLDRRVAIKFPKNGLGRYLPPEVRNAREISHPNVCKIHEIHVARTDQGPVDFISMEFVEGETLLARLRRGALSKQERLVVAQLLCAGVTEAHRNGVIHRDLKSSNILWGTWPGGAVRVVVMDFGLAYAADASAEKSGSERVAGTPAYMAPELWKGAPPSVESDIYALGVVFWELLSGEPPEALGLTSSTLSWEQRPVWKAPTGYGRWDSVLARCLAPEPARRFHSVPEIAKALGPRVAWKWTSAAAAAGVLAGASWVVSDYLAHRPAESVRLALLPFRGGNLQAAVAGKLRADTAAQLSRVRGNQHTGFVFVAGEQRVNTVDEARDRLHVSRVLQPVIESDGSDLAVRVSLTDAGSGADLTSWTATYKASELRYLPTALAGV